MVKFIEKLEKRARRLKKELKQNSWDLLLPSMLKREIALTVDQVDKLRKLHDDQLNSMRENECNINTELIQMEDRTPRYSPYKYPEREKFIRSLMGLEAEKRRLEAHTEKNLRSLEDKLLSLTNKHHQIQTLDDGYRKTSSKTGTFNAPGNTTLAPSKGHGRSRPKSIN